MLKIFTLIFLISNIIINDAFSIQEYAQKVENKSFTQEECMKKFEDFNIKPIFPENFTGTLVPYEEALTNAKEDFIGKLPENVELFMYEITRYQKKSCLPRFNTLFARGSSSADTSLLVKTIANSFKIPYLTIIFPSAEEIEEAFKSAKKCDLPMILFFDGIDHSSYQALRVLLSLMKQHEYDPKVFIVLEADKYRLSYRQLEDYLTVFTINFERPTQEEICSYIVKEFKIIESNGDIEVNDKEKLAKIIAQKLGKEFNIKNLNNVIYSAMLTAQGDGILQKKKAVLEEKHCLTHLENLKIKDRYSFLSTLEKLRQIKSSLKEAYLRDSFSKWDTATKFLFIMTIINLPITIISLKNLNKKPSEKKLVQQENNPRTIESKYITKK